MGKCSFCELFAAILNFSVCLASDGTIEDKFLSNNNRVMTKQDLQYSLALVEESVHGDDIAKVLSEGLKKYFLYGYYPLNLLKTPNSRALKEFVLAHAKDSYLIAEFLPLFSKNYISGLLPLDREKIDGPEEEDPFQFSEIASFYKDSPYDPFYPQLFLPFQMKSSIYILAKGICKDITDIATQQGRIKSSYFAYAILPVVNLRVKQSEKYLKFAAEGGFALAQYVLAGKLYERYKHTESERESSNLQEAIARWLEKASDLGLQEAIDMKKNLDEKGFSKTEEFIKIRRPDLW